MSAVEPLYNLIGIYSNKLSKEESFILEAELFIRIYDELKKVIEKQYMDYFRLLKFTTKMESAMFETNLIQFVIKDILSSGEYTAQGIACYTDTHEDVVLEVATGRNTNPSAIFLRRIIELHRSIRPDLYDTVIKKIISEHTVAA